MTSMFCRRFVLRRDEAVFVLNKITGNESSHSRRRQRHAHVEGTRERLLPKPMYSACQDETDPRTHHRGRRRGGRPAIFHRHRLARGRDRKSFRHDGKKFGATISSTARQTVSAGKAPELAGDFVGDSPFLLTYGDLSPSRRKRIAHLIRRFGEGDFAGVITVTPLGERDEGRPEFFRRTILPETARGKTVARTDGAVAPRRLAQARRSGVV